MLKKILSPKSCAGCRVCCVFDRDDIWEIPLISAELNDRINAASPDLKTIPRGKSYVFDMRFEKDGLTYCPALSDTGCILGENKPFDCQIWPLPRYEKGR